jgi:ABC-2 type transport system permease protein
MNLRIILAIARKDLSDALRNAYLLSSIVLPIAVSLLFRVLFQGDSGAGGRGAIDISIYDAGKSQLVQYMVDSKQFSIFFASSPDEVRSDVEQKGRVGGVVIPANFDAGIAAGEMPDLRLYVNTARGAVRVAVLGEIVTGGLRAVARQTLPARIVRTDVSAAGAGAETSVNLNRFYLTLFLVMSLTMVGVFVVPYMLVEEKEKNTLKAVLVSPATYADVVAGKGLVGLFYALLVAVILLLLNDGFGGNVAVTILSVLLGAIFLVQAGLLMGAVFQTISQVNSWSTVVMLVLMLPGMLGDFLPPPEPIPALMKLIPTSYMVEAMNQGMSNSVTLSSAAINLGVLAVTSLAAFSAVIWSLRRERR